MPTGRPQKMGHYLTDSTPGTVLNMWMGDMASAGADIGMLQRVWIWNTASKGGVRESEPQTSKGAARESEPGLS